MSRVTLENPIVTPHESAKDQERCKRQKWIIVLSGALVCVCLGGEQVFNTRNICEGEPGKGYSFKSSACVLSL